MLPSLMADATARLATHFTHIDSPDSIPVAPKSIPGGASRGHYTCAGL